MNIDLCLWPMSRLGEAMSLAAAETGAVVDVAAETLSPPPDTADKETLDRWVHDAAVRLGAEAESVQGSFPDFARVLPTLDATILSLPDKGHPAFLVIKSHRDGTLQLIDPNLDVKRVVVDDILKLFIQTGDESGGESLDDVLIDAGVSTRGRERIHRSLGHEQMSRVWINAGWSLRLPPSADFGLQMRRLGLTRGIGLLAAAHVLQYLLWLASWWMIGKGALAGRLDTAWLAGWALLLFTLIPLRLFVSWTQGVVAIGTGGLLKQRLLLGTLRLKADDIRTQGMGQFLSRTMEAEAVESLALAGGFVSLMAIIELIISGVILSFGAARWWHVSAMVAWTMVGAFIARRYYLARGCWTDHRLRMTHDLVENITGYRTRVAQQSPENWHHSEEQQVNQYIELSKSMDRWCGALVALVPRGWILVGLVGVLWAFVAGTASPAALAISVGGVLLAVRSFQSLAEGASHLCGAAIAWKQVAALFHTATQDEGRQGCIGSSVAQKSNATGTMLNGYDLLFRHAKRATSVLDGCSFRLNHSERVLLEGASGSGKSTLASVIAGLREPDSGSLLLRGLDKASLGADEWRRRIVMAPQFHDNHILTGTVAFNVLMGRNWPPTPEDMAKAESMCRELGLDRLLDRMPAGMLQMIGETGWRLSQGERSLIYMARTLLQGAKLVILDESFASLDPATFHRCLKTVQKHAPALLVIAHR
jgi:ABC-type multidrug transport system fused ATPase/permease subunit